MKNFLARFSPENLNDSLRDVTRRFPVPVILLILMAGVCYYVINSENEDIIFARILFTGIVTFFLSVGIQLFLESWKGRDNYRWVAILPILYGVFFYFTLGIREEASLESITYFILHLVGFLSLIFFAPYLARILEGEEGSIEYTNYFSRIAWVLLMSAIIGISIMFLGFIAIGSVIALFDLSDWTWDSKLYGNWAITALSLIAPLYALRQLPRFGDIDTKSYETNRFFAFLIRYVATPAIYVYFAILYAYSVKVLANFSDWPKGIVSWLVIGFSSFGYLTYIFSKPYEDSSIVRVFRRYFPYIVIPQIAMLGYAIYLRIAQYDLTMNRYFVVIFGLWLLGISLYYMISHRKSLAIIPASLAALSLLISIGPWSVFSYPQARQEDRLIRHLTEAKILQNGKIIPLASERDISKELSTEVAGGIEYLCSFDDCTRVKAIFPDQAARAEIKAKEEWDKWNKNNSGATFPGASSWDITNGITSELKVQRYPFDNEKREFTEQEYLSYNVDYQRGQFPLDVRGYESVIQVTSESDPKIPNNERVYPYMTVNPDTMKAILTTASGVTREYALTLPQKLRDSATISQVRPEDLTFTLSDDAYEIRLLLQSITVKNPKYIPPADSPTQNITYVGGASGLALVKEKK